MKTWKKLSALVLALAMILTLAAGCGDKSGAGSSAAGGSAQDGASFSIAALKGPTAMGLVKLMEDADEKAAQMLDSSKPYEGEIGNLYSFTLAASADEVTPALIQGELDMACVPANLAAVLYQRTEGQIITLAVNTLGVLYIVENGNAVRSVEDLKGKTIVAAGKGSTPEYALRYLLESYGLDPDGDVTIDWKSEHSECVAALASGAATVAMLPQPFVAAAQAKLGELRVALDLTELWDDLDNGSALLTGVIVARKEVVEENPDAVEAFLSDYAASVDWVNENTAEAAALIGERGIVDASVAEAALPYCNIVCITGKEMKEKLSGYLQVLYDADPASVGVTEEKPDTGLPGDEFYYGA
jgi:NitT/TauT family transport system substrate-binding protein